MSAFVDILEEAERERPTLTTPLLLNSIAEPCHFDTNGDGHSITSDTIGPGDPHASASKFTPESSSASLQSQRIISLDVFRGLTVANTMSVTKFNAMISGLFQLGSAYEWVVTKKSGRSSEGDLVSLVDKEPKYQQGGSAPKLDELKEIRKQVQETTKKKKHNRTYTKELALAFLLLTASARSLLSAQGIHFYFLLFQDMRKSGQSSSLYPEGPILILRYTRDYNNGGQTAAATSGGLNRGSKSLGRELMILVDDAGGAFPSINHSPWFGVTLADFVMPFFLFVVGFSICLVYKKASNRSLATKKVLLRTIKLFLLGVMLQGGFFHGRNNLTYGVDVRKIRWLGVLQRISLGYFLASIAEIWLVNRTIVDLPAGFVRKYYVQWIFAILLCSSYLFLLYGLYVPSWQYDNPKLNLSDHLLSNVTIHCEVRGSLDPPCNAVGYLDRLILGEAHLYQRPVYRRKKECSVNSPDYGPLPPGSPAWCLAPFDPEGILSSLMAAITCLVGLQFGHVFVHFSAHMQRLFLWFMFSCTLLIVGCILEMLGIPLSKPLYTLSYMCITTGASGLLLTIIFYVVDVKQLRKPLILLQWMGMNALAVYALAACELVPAAVEGFYWRSPKNNLIDGTKSLLQALLHSDKWGTLVFVVIEILFWGFVAGLMHKKGLYIKL